LQNEQGGPTDDLQIISILPTSWFFDTSMPVTGNGSSNFSTMGSHDLNLSGSATLIISVNARNFNCGSGVLRRGRIMWTKNGEVIQSEIYEQSLPSITKSLILSNVSPTDTIGIVLVHESCINPDVPDGGGSGSGRDRDIADLGGGGFIP
jgi:hypothetical protein